MLETLNRDEFVAAISGEIDFDTIFSEGTGIGITDPVEQQERRNKIGDVIGYFHDRVGIEVLAPMIRFNDNSEKKLDFDQSLVLVGFATEEMLDLLQNGMENLRPDIFPAEERIGFSDTELKLMMQGGLNIQAKKVEDLWTIYDQVKQRLLLTPADISLKGEWREGAFEGEEAIRSAIEEGRLAQVPNEFGMLDYLSSVDEIQTYVDPRLIAAVSSLYKEFAKDENADIAGFFDFSSGTRDFQKQRLLKKLGFPAAGLSYHNFGEAIDIKVKASNDQDETKWEKAVKLKMLIESLGSVDLLDESEFFGRPVYHLQVKSD